MELDQLKTHLNNKLATDHAGRSGADIAQLLHKRTNSVVGKLKRSLLFEIRLSIPFIILFAMLGIFSKEQSFKVFFAVSCIFLLVVLAVLLYLLKRTTRLSSDLLPVKENLQTIVNIIDEFIKRCFQFAIILVPIGIIFVVALQYHYKETATFSSRFAKGLFTAAWQLIVFLIAYTIGFTVMMYYFARWYLRKLYGKYVLQLKECISELEQL